MEKRRYSEILHSTIPILSILAVSLLAFSRNSKYQIHERDNWQCVICGATDQLEAAHINHDKSNPNYNNPNNGRTLCTQHHLEDHINRRGRNGLSKRANEWAIERLKERV